MEIQSIQILDISSSPQNFCFNTNLIFRTKDRFCKLFRIGIENSVYAKKKKQFRIYKLSL